MKIIDQESADSIKECEKMLKQQLEILVTTNARFELQIEDLQDRVEMLENLLEIK